MSIVANNREMERIGELELKVVCLGYKFVGEQAGDFCTLQPLPPLIHVSYRGTKNLMHRGAISVNGRYYITKIICTLYASSYSS